jgi:hypothetical protein
MPATLDLNTRDGVCTAVIPPQTISSAGTYDLIATITNRAGGRILTLTGIVAGTGPLTGLKLSVAATQAGTHKDRLVDTDFNTATRLLPCCTTNAYQPGSGSTFQFELDITGVAEIKLYGKSTTGATVGLEVGC